MTFLWHCADCGAEHASEGMAFPAALTTARSGLHAGHRILCAAHIVAPVSAEAPRKQPGGDRSKEWDAFRNELRALAERTAKTVVWLDLMREVREAERANRLAASRPEADPPPITTTAQVQQRKRELETLPEDWYIDHDGSYASMPTQATIDQACTAAERALSAGILVDSIEADANGGTCVYLRNADYGEVSLWFGNGGRASVLGHGWREALSESSWAKIEAQLCSTMTSNASS